MGLLNVSLNADPLLKTLSLTELVETTLKWLCNAKRNILCEARLIAYHYKAFSASLTIVHFNEFIMQ